MIKIMMIFAYFGKIEFFYFRLFGPGLGNMLLPWARSIIYAHKYNAIIIEPTWGCLKIGPLIRKEKDSRFYFNIFTKTKGSVRGLKKIYYLIVYKKIYENFFLSNNKLTDNKKKILLVSGLGNYFEDLKEHRSLIKSSLENLIKDQDLQKIKYFDENSISMHIRRSDFQENSGELSRTSDDWFIKVINFLNSTIKKNIYIFSDATDLELSSILKCPNTKRVDYKSSILDMLAMSKSKLFVGSKNSTFSHWVSFLGSMPTIWPNNCHINNKKRCLSINEIETDGQIFSKDFINLCLKKFKS